MRHFVDSLRLFVSAILALSMAGPTHAAAQTGCEAKRRSCVAECRAQYFTVDPKRNACIANCVAEANRCIREQAVQQQGSRGACVLPEYFPDKRSTESCCRVASPDYATGCPDAGQLHGNGRSEDLVTEAPTKSAPAA